MIALRPTPIQMGQWDCCLRMRAPKNPATMAPASGSRGIRNEYWTCQRCSISVVALAFQFFPRVRVERLFLADTRAEADTEDARDKRLRLAALIRERGIEALLKTPPPWLRKGSPHWDPLLKMIRGQTPDGVAQGSVAMAYRPDSRPDLPTIDVPTAVVVGDEDEITPLPLAQAMSEAIPNATLSIIPGAGHIANLEAPTAFESALRAWLRRTA